METKNRYLIVGLGNPGRRYRNNRHNIGYKVIDRLAEVAGIRLARVQSKAITGDGRYGGKSVLLAKPLTFMNLSGNSVGTLFRYYHLPLDNLLVIYDEIDLPFGTLRLREIGGSGGHNGMKSIIEKLGPDFPRLRLGVGRPPGIMEPADYVLQNFHEDDAPIVNGMVNQAAEAVQMYLEEGIDAAMTRYNGPLK